MWFDGEHIAYGLLAAACGWIIWIDLRPFVQGWFRRRFRRQYSYQEKALASLMEDVNISPELKRLLDNIAWLCDDLSEPISDKLTSFDITELVFSEIKRAKADIFYDEAAHGVLKSLELQFEIALTLKATGNQSTEESQLFDDMLDRIRATAMLFARLVGAPVRYHQSESTDSQSPKGIEQKTQP